jgi:hypothetical protein
VGTGHIHDFNPGISPNGVFWTDHIPRSSVQFDLGAVTASLRVTNFAIPDTIPVPTVGAILTMDLEWRGLTAEVKVKDLVNGFAGSYRECHATVNWTAMESNFGFTSDGNEVTRYAAIGRERNGEFFRGQDPD